MPVRGKCPYGQGEKAHSMDKRHPHDYTPPGICTQRCTCGSRKWRLEVGGPLPPIVNCDRCGRENRTATAYERGRFHPHAVEPAGKGVPF
jgi:hypothetical protein